MFFFCLERVTSSSWVPFLWGWSKHIYLSCFMKFKGDVLADVHKKTLTSSKQQLRCWTNLFQSILQNDFLCFCWPLKKSISCKMSDFYKPQRPLCRFFSYIPPIQKKTVESAKSKESSKEEPWWNCGWFRNPAKQLRLLPCDIEEAIRVARDDAFAY